MKSSAVSLSMSCVHCSPGKWACITDSVNDYVSAADSSVCVNVCHGTCVYVCVSLRARWELILGILSQLSSFLLVFFGFQGQQALKARPLISAKTWLSCLRRPNSLTGTWHACKYNVHKLYQRYILDFVNSFTDTGDFPENYSTTEGAFFPMK